jgi:DNA-directed RNA polymerase III subunit RPC11
VFKINSRFASRGAVLKKKQMQDVLGGADAWKDVARTEAKCPSQSCMSKMAYFRQMQIRSADEPMTTFYKCVECETQWKED